MIYTYDKYIYTNQSHPLYQPLSQPFPTTSPAKREPLSPPGNCLQGLKQIDAVEVEAALVGSYRMSSCQQ